MIHQLVEICRGYLDLLGVLTLIFSVIMGLVGLPMQIRKNYKTQTCGLHWTLVIVPLFIFLTRIPYSIGKEAWYIIPADTISLVCCVILLAQLIAYRGNTPQPKEVSP